MEESAPAPAATSESSIIGGGSPAPVQSEGGQLLGGSTPQNIATPDTTPDNISPPAQLWHETLSDEFRENKNISKYNSLDDMLRGHDNLSRKIGEKNMEMPGEGASPDDWNKFYSKIGRPETVDKYTPYAPEMLKDNDGNDYAAFEFDKDQLSDIQSRFHAKGFNDSQMTEAMNAYAEITTQAQTAALAEMDQQAVNTQSELRREYGDKYDAKMKSISAMAESLGIKDTLVEAGLGNNLAVIRMINSLGSQVGESNITGDASPAAGGFDNRLASLKAHPAAKDKGHPEYHSIQNQIIGLYKDKYTG